MTGPSNDFLSLTRLPNQAPRIRETRKELVARIKQGLPPVQPIVVREL